MPDKIKDVLGYSTVVGKKEQAEALGKMLGIDSQKNPIIFNLKDANILSLLTMVTTQKEAQLSQYVSRWNGSERPQ